MTLKNNLIRLIELVRILNFIPDTRVHVDDLTLDTILDIYKNPFSKLENGISLTKMINNDIIDSYWITLNSNIVEYHDTYGLLSNDVDEIIEILESQFQDEIREYKLDQILNKKKDL